MADEKPAAVVPPAEPKGVGVVEAKPGIRIFDDAAIMAAVDKAVAALPPGKDVAAVAFVDTDKTVKLAATVRLGDEWSIVVKGEKPYHKPIKGEAMVVWSK